ncbi:hypothetical protein G9F72_023920 [Clostridium estertheticum]|uniref:hypothetical protein n=1 Tax=Clostridium estertheticum TaxID=238834 RepID=UPI0013E93665|nr:hypothetical protein [Clostridium estertheticum]MBZ9689348.1 hypothetical protein [Clostridium estertheticum]
MANRFDNLDKMTDGPTAYFIGGANGQNKELKQENLLPITLTEKPLSKQERLVYSLLEQYCDFIMCENEEHEEDYLFYSKEQFNIFAKDKGGGVYGFIGGIGNIEDENVPIAYVSSDGQSGKIANNLKELLSLIIFYPFWIALLILLKHYNGDIQKIIELCIKEIVEDMPNFYEIQQTIADNLGIKRQDCSVEYLFNCLSEEPKFIVYSTVDNNPSQNLLM